MATKIANTPKKSDAGITAFGIKQRRSTYCKEQAREAYPISSNITIRCPLREDEITGA
jgi:hypothetical protein